MSNKILITFLLLDALFLLSGALILVVGIVFRPGMNTYLTMQTDASIMLLMQSIPLTAAVANAVLIFFTFCISIPGAVLSRDRIFLKTTSWLLIASALFSLALGLRIWYSTLNSKINFGVLWSLQTSVEQSLLQQQFNCCGYMSSTTPSFVVDSVCPNAATAIAKGGCIMPFWSFANGFLDVVFTILFGIVALDGMLFLSTIVVIKDRAQKERYRFIDQKSGLRI